VAGAAVLVVAATTHFAQFWLATAAAFATRLGAPARFTALAVAALLVFAYAHEITRLPQEMAENPNKGIRVAFVADAFSSLRDTYGLGIGYGKESVRWTYRFPGVPTFSFMPNPRMISSQRLLEVLSQAVHNSFVQAMLRTGVLGAGLLLLDVFAAFPRRTLSKPIRSHRSCSRSFFSRASSTPLWRALSSLLASVLCTDTCFRCARAPRSPLRAPL